jgi:hypothetical protein
MSKEKGGSISLEAQRSKDAMKKIKKANKTNKITNQR